MLTQQQETFVQELIKGKTQREAYKAAYPNCKAKPCNIDSKASNLFKSDKVKARYNELMNSSKGVDDATSMRAFIIEQLKKIASGEICDKTEEYDADGLLIKSKRTVKANDVSNALTKLAEFYGVVEQQDTNITVRFESEINEYGE